MAMATRQPKKHTGVTQDEVVERAVAGRCFFRIDPKSYRKRERQQMIRARMASPTVPRAPAAQLHLIACNSCVVRSA